MNFANLMMSIRSSSEIEGPLIPKKNTIFLSFLRFRTKVSPSSIKSQNPEDHKFLLPGLKILVYTREQPENTSYIVHSTASFRKPIARVNSVLESLSRSRSADIDDVLGSESGVYVSPITPEPDSWPAPDRAHVKKGRRYESSERNFPPPIPLLAQTGNLHAHMPWVLTRNFVDGRLILTEERVKHHEYFEAHRENGRLVLTLVQLDGVISSRLGDVFQEELSEEEEGQEVEDGFWEMDDGESEPEEGDHGGELFVTEDYIGNLYCNVAAPAPEEHMIGNQLTQPSTPLIACM